MRGLVVGATSWGVTLAGLILRAGHEAAVLCRGEAEAAQFAARRRHPRLPDLALPTRIEFTAAPPAAADAVIWCAPSQRMRRNLEQSAAAGLRPAVHVSAAKGIERATLLRMSEVMRQCLGPAPIAVLSGPNIAREIAAGLPAASVAASESEPAAALLRDLLGSPGFRVYTNSDVVGVELGGALKNVIAIAAGMADALGAGDNARAALMTRGLAEIARLGRALGGSPATFAGLSGMGDLLATCTSPGSRNRSFGRRIAAGMSVADAIDASDGVVEGVETVPVALALADRTGSPMPVASLVSRVLFDGLPPRDAIPLLMQRAPTGEWRAADSDHADRLMP